MLGPMVNPASPANQLVGVFNLELARVYNYIYQQTDINYSIVHSLDGYDEISLTGEFKLLSQSIDSILGPDYFGFEKLDAKAIRGGDSVQDSASIFENILKGDGSSEQNSVVLANSVVAINTIYPERNINECLELANKSLFGGDAYSCFKKLLS